MHSCRYIFLGSCSNDFFNLHTPSAPEIFSRTEKAAAAAELTVGRFGLLMPSSTSLWRQLWANSRLSSSASAWSVRNQAATTYTIMNPLYTLIILEKIETKLLCMFNAVNSVGICWHHKLKEPNMSPARLFPHSPPMAASKTSHSHKFSRRSQQHRCKKQTTNDVLGILAMRLFQGDWK